jgi:hypothetical protein
MKTKQLRSFLEEYVTSLGGTTEARGDNLLGLQLPESAEEIVGTREVLLAFNLRGLQEESRSELATVGNPLFERLLELARESGRVGQRFHPAGTPPARLPDPAEEFHFEGRVILGPPHPAYTPLYYFIFRTEYSLEEHADELEVIPLDGISGKTLGQTPELVEFWEGLEVEPAPGRLVVPTFPVREGVLRAALQHLEKRVRKRLGKMRRESDERLARESHNIETYYRQLIEEARNTGRRWAISASQREERVRVLQLDWKRRIEEANLHWRPRIDVHLISAAAAMVPRVAWEISPAGGARKGPAARKTRVVTARSKGSRPRVFWDEAEKSFVEPACGTCGNTSATWVVSGDALRCPACAEADRG